MCVFTCVCRCPRRPDEGVGCPGAEVAEIVSSPALVLRAELRSSARVLSCWAVCRAPLTAVCISACFCQEANLLCTHISAGRCLCFHDYVARNACPFCPSVLLVPLYAGESLDFAICKFSLTAFVFTYSMSSIYI